MTDHIAHTLDYLFNQGADMQVYGQRGYLFTVGIHNIHELRAHGLTHDEALHELSAWVIRKLEGIE